MRAGLRQGLAHADEDLIGPARAFKTGERRDEEDQVAGGQQIGAGGDNGSPRRLIGSVGIGGRDARPRLDRHVGAECLDGLEIGRDQRYALFAARSFLEDAYAKCHVRGQVSPMTRGRLCYVRLT